MGSLRDGLIKMADCIIKKNGANADTSDLTALPSSVKKGKIFLGRGSDDEQIGKMPIIQPERYELQLNQTLSLGEGFYEAGSTVTQNIPTLGNQYVVPSADLQTIETAGKYMEGDVFVESLQNLIASNIKKNVVIRVGDTTIVGTYEGYENDDPYTPYYNGVFGPGQSISSFPSFGRKGGPYYKGDVTFGRDNIHIENPLSTDYVTTAIVFNVPLNFDNINRITLKYSLANASGGCEMVLATGYVSDYIYMRDSSGSGKDYNSGLGDYWRREIPNTSGNLKTNNFDVSNITGTRFIYISLFMRTTASTSVVNMTLRELKCTM